MPEHSNSFLARGILPLYEIAKMCTVNKMISYMLLYAHIYTHVHIHVHIHLTHLHIYTCTLAYTRLKIYHVHPYALLICADILMKTTGVHVHIYTHTYTHTFHAYGHVGPHSHRRNWVKISWCPNYSHI